MNQAQLDQSLLRAITQTNLEKTKELLEQEANPNAVDSECHITPLHAAARIGNVPIIEILIEYGADPNKQSNKITPLLAAIYKGHLAAVKALLKAKANPNKTGEFGITPMEAAAADDKIEIGKELLKYEAKTTNKEWLNKLNISKLQ